MRSNRTRLPSARVLSLLLASLVLLSAGPAFARPAKSEIESLASAPVTTAVFRRVNDAYIDPERFDYGGGLEAALRAVEGLVPEFKADYKPGAPVLNLQMNNARKTLNVEYMRNLPAALDVMKKTYSFIGENLDSVVDIRDIEYAATNGFLETLDPHSRVLPPRIYDEFMVSTSGSFGGLGIVIGTRENKLTVISPLDDTPAARAGMRSGDVIVRIEDESTENMPLDEAVRRLRGPEGTEVTITVQREGEPEPFDVSLIRDVIEIKSVEGKLLDGNVGYVRVTSFQENTARDLQSRLAMLRAEVPGDRQFKGLILDLRNNPGGLLDQAIQVTDLFLPAGEIVSTVMRVNRKTERAHRFRTERNYPMVVLVNEGSASASEIVAGALRNHGRALLVGSRTFGKGSVQNIFELPQGGALKLTVAEYLTPGDVSIQSVGVVPHIKLIPVELTPNEIKMTSSEARAREENLDAHLESVHARRGQRPDEMLSFLIDHSQKTQEQTEVEESAEQYDNDLNLEEDYPAAFARRLILAATASGSDPMLKGARSLIARERSEQQDVIAKALGKRGLNWVSGTTSLPVALDVDVDVVDGEGRVLPAAKAGEKHNLRVTVMNNAKSPIFRLRGLSTSDLSTLDRREFVFGRLAPGKSLSQTIPFRLPEGILGRTEGMKFTFWVDDSVEVARVSKKVRIDGLGRPIFALRYELLDSPKRGEGVQGNGDRQINPGEVLGLKVTVSNIGQGASPSSILRLRSAGGPLVEVISGRGTFKFDNLAPDQEQSATLLFHVKPEYLESEVPLELSVVDREFAAAFVEELDLAVVRPGAPIPPKDALERAQVRDFSPPKVEMKDMGPAGIDTRARNVTLAGQFFDDKKVKDFYVAVNGVKAVYRTFEGAASDRADRFNFNVSVPVEAGSNFVMIVVRDGEGLETRYPLFVWREAPDAAVGEATQQGR